MLILLGTGCGGGTESSDTESSAESTASPAAEPHTEEVSMDTTAQPATWTDDGGAAHEVEIAPESLVLGSESDLENVHRNDKYAGMVPYYLRFSYTNTGPDELRDPEIHANFSLTGADGRPAEPLNLTTYGSGSAADLPGECDNSEPDKLGADRAGRACQIFLLSPDQLLASVTYLDEGGSTLVWEINDDAADGTDDGVLPLGETGETVWRDSDDNDLPMQATLKNVAVGTMDDLSDFDVDDEGRLPHYVTVEYRNDGDFDLYPNMQKNVWLWTTGGEQARELALIDVYGRGVDACPKTVPNEMVKPGGTVTQCSIYLLAEGDSPNTVLFAPSEEGAPQITWHADS